MRTVAHMEGRSNKTAPSKWAVLFTIVIMSFMSTLDGSVVNVALPAMQRELAVTAADIQWVSSVYLLVCCATVLVFGQLGDRFGKVKFFQLGVALFTVGSLLCGMATSLPALIAARALQGTGAASAMANNMGIVTEVFPTSERGRALGIVSTFVSLGLMCGPVLGGILVAAFPWESIFLINVPVGVAALLAGMRFLPADAPSGAMATGALSNLRGIVSLLANPAFVLNLVTMFICFFAVGSTELILPFFLQDACGYTPDVAGVLLTSIPLAMAVVGPVAGAVSDRVGSTGPCLVGLVIYAVGIAFVGMLSADATAVRIYITVVVMSLGTGMFQAPNNSLVMGSAGQENLGFAGSMVALVRYLGMAVGTTGGTALLYGRMSELAGRTVTSFVPGEVELFMGGFSFTFFVIAALVAAGAVLTIAGVAVRRAQRGHLSKTR